MVSLLLIFTLAGCNPEQEELDPVMPDAEQYDARVVTDWFDLVSTLTRETPGYTPPVAARAFGYTGVALYEAVAPGTASLQSLSGQLNAFALTARPEEGALYHWPSSANAALATMVKTFYAKASPERLEAVNALETRFSEQFKDEASPETIARSVAFGEQVAQEILTWSESDGGHQGDLHNFPEYTPPTGDQYWVPTAPGYGPALQPYWGNNRPFITANVTESQPIAPPPFSHDANSEFYRSAREVYEMVNDATPEQIVIARYWSDDPISSATPPGHSIAILNQVLLREDASLSLAAEAYGKLGIAIGDAFIACWKTKYDYNLIRPVTYINRYIDASWSPILPTPPFPEYTSGHSVQSGAMATVLTDLFGENYAFVDSTHAKREDIDGLPRKFASFKALAEEAAISRMYGGIHYREAVERGLTQGYVIGENVNKLNMRSF